MKGIEGTGVRVDGENESLDRTLLTWFLFVDGVPPRVNIWSTRLEGGVS